MKTNPDSVRKNKDGLVKVDFFSCEVKYTGDFEDNEKEILFARAYARQYKNIDCWNRSEWMSLEEAEKLDGAYEIEDRYPCNRLAMAYWSYIDDNPLELDEDDDE